MPTVKHWLQAARLRTLPLALSSILMGCFLAVADGSFRLNVGVLAVLTTILLQVLSNFANDYGDAVNGKDTDDRQGPQRTVQAGVISPAAMRNAMILLVVLALISGITLLWTALADLGSQVFWWFLGLGLLAIVAAITYTAGKNPYGYVGLGDVSVLVFFGWVGVLGTYYLHTNSFSGLLLLPASSCGLFAVAVLNINNIRDIASDALTGKKSIPVRLGRSKAVIYHWAILVVGMSSMIIFGLLTINAPWQWLFLASYPLFLRNGWAIAWTTSPKALDPSLKQMALSTLFFVLLYGLGQMIQHI